MYIHYKRKLKQTSQKFSASFIYKLKPISKTLSTAIQKSDFWGNKKPTTSLKLSQVSDTFTCGLWDAHRVTIPRFQELYI